MPNILMRRWMIAIIAAIAVGCGASPEPPVAEAPTSISLPTLPPTIAVTPTFAPTTIFEVPEGRETAFAPTPTQEPITDYFSEFVDLPLPNNLDPLIYQGVVPFGARRVLGTGDIDMHVSPLGQYYAITDWYGARIYDGLTLEPLWDASRPGQQVAWMSDNTRVAVGTVLYDIQTGETVLEATPIGQTYVWSPDGQTIASNDEGRIVIQDTVTGTVLASITSAESEQLYRETCTSQNCGEHVIRFSFSPNGTYLYVRHHVSVMAGDAVQYYASLPYATIFEARSGEEIVTLQRLPTRLQFTLLRWRWDEQAVAYPTGGADSFETGNTLSVSLTSGTITNNPSYDPETWAPRAIEPWDILKGENDTYLFIQEVSSPCGAFAVRYADDLNRVEQVYYAPSQVSIKWIDFNSLLAYDDQRGMTYTWNINSGQVTDTSPFDASSGSLDYSHKNHSATYEDRVAAHINADKSQYFVPSPYYFEPDPYNLLVDGEIIATFETEIPLRIAWSPDGTRLAVSFVDHVKVIDPDTGITIVRMAPPATLRSDMMFYDVAWSPDGTRLAGSYTETGAEYGPCTLPIKSIGSIIVWDAETGDIIDGWVAHEGGADEVAFSPDGSLLASRGRGGEIIVWEVP